MGKDFIGVMEVLLEGHRAAGSWFGGADRICLVSGEQRVVSSRRTPPLGTNNLCIATSLSELADKDVEGKLAVNRSGVGDKHREETRGLQAQLEVWVRLGKHAHLVEERVYKFGLQD